MSAEDIHNKKLNELKSIADKAYLHWLKLYRDRDSLIDQEKRAAMLRARQAYQDAVADYVHHAKTKKPKKKR